MIEDIRLERWREAQTKIQSGAAAGGVLVKMHNRSRVMEDHDILVRVFQSELADHGDRVP